MPQQPLTFTIPTAQKIVSSALSATFFALAWLPMSYGGYATFLAWGLFATSGFFAVQSTIYLLNPEVCRIQDDTLIIHVGPFGQRRVHLDDIIAIESEHPYLTLHAHDPDHPDDTRLLSIATNVLSSPDRQRLIRTLKP